MIEIEEYKENRIKRVKKSGFLKINDIIGLDAVDGLAKDRIPLENE